MKDKTLTYKIIFYGWIGMILTVLIMACYKEERNRYFYTQLMLVYRTKCGPDSIFVHQSTEPITGDEMNAIIRSIEFEKWMKREELLYIQVYNYVKLPDSVWVKSTCYKNGHCATGVIRGDSTICKLRDGYLVIEMYK